MNAPKQLLYVQDLFDLAGSATKFAASIDLPQRTVEHWKKAGIPIDHWPKIIRKYNVTLAELYSLSIKCRARVNKPSKCK